MKKILLVLGMILLLGIIILSAHESNFSETKQLIDSGISCNNLDDQDLEAIGEYYMEQMHPGEAHELMDKMMGGEGSETLKQMHINMAKTIYCGESEGMIDSGDMMGMMSMMGGGMMSGQNMQGSMMGSGGSGFGYFINVLFIILLIGLIILVYLWIIKLWKNMKNKGDIK